MADYDPQALLSMPLSDVKPPVPLPVGSYVGTVVKYEFDKAKTQEGQTIVRFQIRFDEPLPDVPEEEFATAIDPKQGGKLLADNLQRLEFWITPAALYRLKQFGEEHLGISEDEASNTLELVELCVGRQGVFVMGESPNKKEPSKPYRNILSTAALPES